VIVALSDSSIRVYFVNALLGWEREPSLFDENKSTKSILTLQNVVYPRTRADYKRVQSTKVGKARKCIAVKTSSVQFFAHASGPSWASHVSRELHNGGYQNQVPIVLWPPTTPSTQCHHTIAPFSSVFYWSILIVHFLYVVAFYFITY